MTTRYSIPLLIRDYKLATCSLIAPTNILTSTIRIQPTYNILLLPFIYRHHPISNNSLSLPSEQPIMSAPNTPLSDLAVNSTTPAGSLEASPNVQPMHQGNAISALEMQRQLLQQKLAEQCVSPTLSKWQQ